MAELGRDAGEQPYSAFVVTFGGCRITRNPTLIRPLSYPEKLRLASLRHSEDLIEPTHHVLGWPILGKRLPLRDACHEETKLLKSDSDRPSFPTRITVLDRAKSLQSAALKFDPKIGIDCFQLGGLGIGYLFAQLSHKLEDRNRYFLLPSKSAVGLCELVRDEFRVA